jgi:hypothetical protein
MMHTNVDATVKANAAVAGMTPAAFAAACSQHRRLWLPDRDASADLVTVDGEPRVRIVWDDDVEFFPLVDATYELVGAVDDNGCEVGDPLSFLGASNL